jgi:hypothetical protein
MLEAEDVQGSPQILDAIYTMLQRLATDRPPFLTYPITEWNSVGIHVNNFLCGITPYL